MLQQATFPAFNGNKSGLRAMKLLAACGFTRSVNVQVAIGNPASTEITQSYIPAGMMPQQMNWCATSWEWLIQ